MKRVYVAGLYGYTTNGIIGNLDNMREGMRKSVKVLLEGYAPFVPWFDYHFQLMLREYETLDADDYYDYSLAWLEVSDAVLVISNRKESKGVNAEIERAKELNIPIFYSLEELKEKLER